MGDDARFCPKCGKATASQVPSGSEVQPENAVSIRKCPACGATVPAMIASCQFCGHEFINVQVVSSVKNFFERLDELDHQAYLRNAEKEDKGPLGGALGAMLGLDAISKLATGMGAAEKRKMEMIHNFPIPNSREDILEFVILACSRVKIKVSMMGNINWMAEKKEAEKFKDAWTAKIRQAHAKAQIIFSSDKTGLMQVEKIIKDAKVKL